MSCQEAPWTWEVQRLQCARAVHWAHAWLGGLVLLSKLSHRYSTFVRCIDAHHFALHQLIATAWWLPGEVY